MLNDIKKKISIKICEKYIKTRNEPTDIAGGTPTSGSWKNLFASARANRLLCIPV